MNVSLRNIGNETKFEANEITPKSPKHIYKKAVLREETTNRNKYQARASIRREAKIGTTNRKMMIYIKLKVLEA